MHKVDVIMSVYNCENYIKSSISSILNQTFTNFRLIVINDASTDNTHNLIREFNDSRIHYIYNEKNYGLTKSLNIALSYANAEYIARMDCDDVSLPDRLSRQVQFLDLNQDVGIVGSWYYRLTDTGRRLVGIVKKPISNEEICWSLLLENPFGHPTVMFRRNIIVDNKLKYNQNFAATQDYDLWVRILSFSKGANIEKPLLGYRVHSSSISSTKRCIQQKNSAIIAKSAVKRFLPGFKVTQSQLHNLQMLLFGDYRLKSPPNINQVYLADLYLNMYFYYISLFNVKLNKNLKICVARNALHLIISSPLDKNFLRILKKIVKINPYVLLSYTVFFLKVFFSSLGRILLLKK